MSTTPPIVITRPDRERLERLLDGLPASHPTAEQLEAEVARARVVAESEVPPGVVTMNSRVRCREEVSGREYRLTLVYPEDAGADGTVSVLAPAGCALLGLSVGQLIDWPGPAGRPLRLKLLEVEYQPEAAGDRAS